LIILVLVIKFGIVFKI